MARPHGGASRWAHSHVTRRVARRQGVRLHGAGRNAPVGGVPCRCDQPPAEAPHGQQPRLAQVQFANQEVVTFKARDGLELQGVLVRPLDERPGQRYPLILTVHGGPEAHDRNGWTTGYSNPGQMAAARGFAVFYPNYRGSTGPRRRGSRSRPGRPGRQGVRRPRGRRRSPRQHRPRRPGKVGITGGSYGGYATAGARPTTPTGSPRASCSSGSATRSSKATRRTSPARSTSCTRSSAVGRLGRTSASGARSPTREFERRPADPPRRGTIRHPPFTVAGDLRQHEAAGRAP